MKYFRCLSLAALSLNLALSALPAAAQRMLMNPAAVSGEGIRTQNASSPAQTLNTLVNLFGSALPFWPPIQGRDGFLYGTTTIGGNNGLGVVYRMTLDPVTFEPIYSFSGSDGQSPEGITEGTDGNLYGTTYNGGANNDGTVFRITPSGTMTTLHQFSGTDGSLPFSTLVQANDGNFYGTTLLGGASNNGSVYRISPNGTLATLYSFCSQANCADGSGPVGSLVQGVDGNLYGKTIGGSLGNNNGTVFKITLNGVLTTLHAFDFTNGSSPCAGLIQATDGSFYGTTAYGGANTGCPNANLNTCGIVFKITPDGTFMIVHNFSGGDGGTPESPLMQSSDGNLYGTTYLGGQNNHGTAFKLTLSGQFTSFYSFCSRSQCTDGTYPYAGLVQGNNGRLFGTTAQGGDLGCGFDGGCGTVFEFTGFNGIATQFVPITPCRLVDTRQGSSIQAGTWNMFDVSQLGGCNVPSNATAYSLNVTAIPHGRLGYMTVWPAGRAMPAVSTMNSLDGRIKANASVMSAGAAGAVSVYVTDTSDVLLDINGYFTIPTAETLQFYPVVPCRLVDTRNGRDGGTLQAGLERDYSIAGNCGIPAGAKAYSVNVTAIPVSGGFDYLTVWPQGEQRPDVSTLNNSTGTVVANAAIVSAGSNQAVAFYANSNNTDLLLDVNGYFADPGAGGKSFVSMPPCRAYDSRSNHGQPFQGERTVNIVNSTCDTRTMASTYLLNATVTPSSTLGYLTLWADAQMMPGVSTLNAYDGSTTSNMAIVPSVNGSIDAYASGLTQLVLDISGYFTH
jgi:uncharacterized repeat protein (TIGR03803 family)